MKTSSRPFLRWLFHFCGSIKLAMLLLAVLIIAIITGTIVESRLDTSVAQSYIYDAPWFIAWLVLLCVNLVGAVLVRYPWKPYQLGFIITHAGIIVILGGAIIGRIWGFEGSLTLFKDEPPTNILLTGRQVLEATSATATKIRTMNLAGKKPTPDHPVKLKVGETEIAAIDFAPELALRADFEKAESNGAPALRLVMNSAMVRQPFDRWLLLDNAQHGEVEFGPAIIRYASAPSAGETTSHAAEPKQVPSREVHFAFAKMPTMNMVRLSAGVSTGIKPIYEFSEDQQSDHYKGKLELQTDTGSFTFLVSDLIGRETPIKGTPWTIASVAYFAELRMQGKQPVSVSDQPNNPALQFEILGPLVSENSSADTTAHHEHDSAQPANRARKAGMAELNIFRDANGELSFSSLSRSKASHTGKIRIGQEFFPGLADWKCRVEEVTDHAVVHEHLTAVSEEAPQSIGASGLLIRSQKGASTDTQWIPMGHPTQIQVGGENIELNFRHKLLTLDFTVALEKFEVEMNEGTETPASFKSHVRFHDSKKETTVTRAVWMNNPANFPQFAGAGLLGTSYKFSQSSWNPNNLNETTLQVIRDPGWSLKWIGSLLLCAGLFTIFYLKPYPRLARPDRLARPVSAPLNTKPKAREEMLVGK